MSVYKLVLLFFLLFFFELLSFCEASPLDKICQEASQMPLLLQSYHCAFLNKSSVSDRPGELAVMRLTIWQSGHNIRTRTDYFPKKGQTLDSLTSKGFIYAYNGEHYQWFSPGREALTFSERCQHPTPYWTPNALLVPYRWLVGPEANWSDVKDPERWLNRFKEVQYIGEETENGITFDVISLPHLQIKSSERMKVYCARELNYYPLKWVFPFQKNGLNGIMEANVIKYRIFDIDAKKLIFPTIVQLLISGQNGNEVIKLGTDFYLDEVLTPLQINPKLDDELFTISPSLAKTVTDFDAEITSGRVRPADDEAQLE